MVMPRSRSISIEFEHLIGHLARRQPAGDLDQPVRQRRLAVVDMGHDREIADAVERNQCAAGSSKPARP